MIRDDSNVKSTSPLLPKRSILAAILSAVLASLGVSFVALGDLDSVGRETFQFSRSLDLQDESQRRLNGFLAKALHDDRVVVTIIGHSGDTGEATANLKLSSERAALIATITEEIGVTRDRINVLGVGGSDPLPKLEGESDRVYQSRLARVDVSMQVRR